MHPSTGLIEQMLQGVQSRRKGDLSDAHLVKRYLAGDDPQAFTLLVQRYGPMVWGVCSRVLRCPHDAADAFQATFVVLARRAGVIAPPGRVGAWLFGVARQTALRSRALAARRNKREQLLSVLREPSCSAGHEKIHDRFHELKNVLDEAILALPAKYRMPVILCDLEEKTHRDAACQLGWPVGTVSGRLVRGRRMLALRLARRGIALPTGALLAVAAEGASMPTGLLKETAQAASLTAAAPLTPSVIGLATGVISAMFLNKCKLAAGLLFTFALSMLALGNVGWAQSDSPEAPQGAAHADHHQDHTGKVATHDKVEDTPLRKLQREKLEVLTKAMQEVHALRTQGKATFMDAAQSHHAVCKAEFDLATNNEDRMKAINKQIKWAKQIEENAKQLAAEDKFSKMDLYKVTTDRIDAEIALEKLKSSAHAEHK